MSCFSGQDDAVSDKIQVAGTFAKLLAIRRDGRLCLRGDGLRQAWTPAVS
jgi:hypothetical protein